MSILENIIAQMEGEAVTTTKTAAVAAPAPTSSSEERMLATVRNLTAKTAAAAAQPQGSAVDALQKIAHETAAMEEEVMLKQAEFAGAAMCDGFMSRFAQYDGAVGGSTKTASNADMQKVAEEAYAQGVADLEKQASDAYAQGYQAQIQEIHKIASEIHVAGQQSARNVLQALSKEASSTRPFDGAAAEKVAASEKMLVRGVKLMDEASPERLARARRHLGQTAQSKLDKVRSSVAEHGKEHTYQLPRAEKERLRITGKPSETLQGGTAAGMLDYYAGRKLNEIPEPRKAIKHPARRPIKKKG